jgi:CheY-like chemotaxis protein
MSRQVLVVDDDADMREAVGAILALVQVNTLFAESGEAALKLFCAQRSRIDAILLDMRLPGISGEETLRLLRQIDYQTPIIVSSGYAVADAALSAYEAVSVLSKPYTADHLIRAVNSVLRSGPFFDEGVSPCDQL